MLVVHHPSQAVGAGLVPALVGAPQCRWYTNRARTRGAPTLAWWAHPNVGGPPAGHPQEVPLRNALFWASKSLNASHYSLALWVGARSSLRSGGRETPAPSLAPRVIWR